MRMPIAADIHVKWHRDSKAARVLRERDITLELATAVLQGATRIWLDAAHSTPEETRWRALGRVAGLAYLVVYSWIELDGEPAIGLVTIHRVKEGRYDRT